MDKEYKFYINDVELKHDIYNFSDVSFNLFRNSDYWGYYRGVALPNLEFVKEDAKLIKEIWESGNINTVVNFKIEAINRKFNKYTLFEEGVLDFNSYSEKLDVNNVLIVSVGFINSVVQEKLKSRGKNSLKIGDNLSVEGESLSGFNLLDITYKRSKQRFFSSWRWSTYLQSVSLGSALESTIPTFGDINRNVTNSYRAPLGLELQNSNDNSAQSEVNEGSWAYYPSGVSGRSSSGIMFSESPITRIVTFKTDLQFKMSAVLDSSLIDGSDYSVRVGLVKYQWNETNNVYDRIGLVTAVASTVVNINSTDAEPITNVAPFDGALDGLHPSSSRFVDFNFNVDIDQTFTKEATFVYGLEFDVVPLGSSGVIPIYWYGLIESGDNNSVISYYDDNLDEYPDTINKGVMVYEALDSLAQQITDERVILKSNYFGKTENGYSTDGDGSLLAITSGFLLRNAINSDGTNIGLNLNFYDLYTTLDKLKGLAMWWDGNILNIEKRSDAFGTKETLLTYSELSSEIMSDLIYTSVLVGNKRIPYEDVNGTNEHNTILEFSTPIRTTENELDLVTTYNTDYTGIERARRLSFVNSDNVDTKYDDKIFISVVERFNSSFKTVLGFNGFDIIEGINLPDEAGNLELSPKRMLLNNSDLLDTCFWKVNKDLTFKNSENLSTLVSQKAGEDLITEHANVSKSEMVGGEVLPFLHSLTVGAKQIIETLNNPMNYYYFYIGEKKITGELWSAKIKDNKGTIEIIERK